MASLFELAATGGTFDIIHKGHLALLAKSFAVSKKVIIGLTGDAMAARRKKHTRNDYDMRCRNLARMIEREFAGAAYEIIRLDDDFGPAVLTADVQALITSEETRPRGAELNLLRAKRGLRPVHIISVPLVRAADGSIISSTRIRDSEMDSEGKPVN